MERHGDVPDHDLGDESNPDVGISPGHGKDDAAGDPAQWATVGRVQSESDDDAPGDDLDAA